MTEFYHEPGAGPFCVPMKFALSVGSLPLDDNGKRLSHPELQHLEGGPEAAIPALESPEPFLLFVTGGSTHYAHFSYGTYGIAMSPVEEV